MARTKKPAARCGRYTRPCPAAELFLPPENKGGQAAEIDKAPPP